MNPREKAHELSMKFDREGETDNAIKCALIAVDEIIESHQMSVNCEDIVIEYWQEVKKEINKL